MMKLSRHLLADVGPAIHFVDDVEPDLVDGIRQQGLFVAAVDLHSVADERSLFVQVSSALSFPAYFGGNWDAMVDCLGDLTWLGASGYVIKADNTESFMIRHPRLAGQFIEICVFAADEWRQRQKPFHVVFKW